MSEQGGWDFFVSYAGANAAWARWIAIELEQAGYTTVSQVLDFRPGQDFVHEMQQATASAARTIAVISPAYAGSEFGEAEWRPAFAQDPSGAAARLVPVRVQACRPEGLLRTRVYVDLVDLDEDAARDALLSGVGPAPPRPTSAPFPGTTPAGDAGRLPQAEDRFPGAGPRVSNLGRRRREFTGRDEQLERLHTRLHASEVAAVLGVEAVHGLGGVGKTELVREFAHRFASDYSLIWWIPAEQPSVAAEALTGLGRRLGLPEAADQAEMVAAVFEQLARRSGWLLIYDNAEAPRALDGLLPPSGGRSCAGDLAVVGVDPVRGPGPPGGLRPG